MYASPLQGILRNLQIEVSTAASELVHCLEDSLLTTPLLTCCDRQPAGEGVAATEEYHRFEPCSQRGPSLYRCDGLENETELRAGSDNPTF